MSAKPIWAKDASWPVTRRELDALRARALLEKLDAQRVVSVHVQVAETASTASASETASDARALRDVVPHVGWEWAVRANRARKWPTWVERGKD